MSTPSGWIRRHKVISTLVALFVLGWTMDAAAGDGPWNDAGSARDPDKRDSSPSSPSSGNESGGDRAAPNGKPRPKPKPAGKSTPTPGPKPKPEPVAAPEPRTFLVTRVIDGDTIELGNGADVRIVGIDTPEVGRCGYDAASANMARLVLGKQVRLTVSDERVDHYGRWLRYVDVGAVDAGLQQIRQGYAIARYDSRDGYGFHVREPRYIAVDRASRNRSCSKPVPLASGVGGGCGPGYAPCIPAFPPDVDCADVDGPISVTGADPHALDADGDGTACE